jgi:hypothetical protein
VHGVSHSVDNSQGYRTTLQLRGGDLLSGSLTLAPVASFTFQSEAENMGGRMLTVISLDATASYDPDGSIADPSGYVWTANQSITMGTGKRKTVYADTTGWVGNLEITLTVTDNSGATSTNTQTVPYGTATAAVVIPSIYAAINNNASATINGGQSWNDRSGSTCISVGARPNDGVITGYACYGFSNGVIKRTTDGCASAGNLSTVYTLASGAAINYINWDWRNPNVVWAISEDCQVLISLDGGATWSVYSAIRSVAPVAGAAAPSAVGNTIGLPAAGGVYIFGGDGAGNPLIMYDPIVGSLQWTRVTFTGNLATDMPADSTMRIVDYAASGNGLEAMILSWASGGGASITAVYYTDVNTSPPGPTRAFTRAGTTFGGLKTGRFIVQDTTTFHCAFANRSVWHSTDGATWTETTNVFPANTVPWHALWAGQQNGTIQGGVFFAALEDTVTPNNGYIVKSVDGFVTAPIMRPTTGDITVTWPASAKGKKISIGAEITRVDISGNVYAQGQDIDNVAALAFGSSIWFAKRTTGTTKYFSMLKYGAGALWRSTTVGICPTCTNNRGNLERSLDGGVTWQIVGPQYATDPDGTWGVVHFNFGPDGSVWSLHTISNTCTHSGSELKLYRCRNPLDPNPTFELVYTDTTGASFGGYWYYSGEVHPHRTNPDIVFMFGAPPVNVDYRYYYTLNATATSPSFTKLEPANTNASMGAFLCDDNAIVSGRSNILRYSTDWGVNWTNATDADIGGNVTMSGTTFDSVGPRSKYPSSLHFAVTSSSGLLHIWRTSDNGRTWRRIVNTTTTLAIARVEYDHIADNLYLTNYNTQNLYRVSGISGLARDAGVVTDIFYNLSNLGESQWVDATVVQG